MDRDWIIIFVLGMGWGAAFFFNAVLLAEFGPYTIGFLRVFTAAITCWLITKVFGINARVPADKWLPLILIGFAMFAVPMAAFPLGQQYIASGIAGIINALTPVVVVIVAHFWPESERATKLKVLGVVAGFCGIVLITIPELATGEDSRLLGILICLLGPLGYGFGTNLIRTIKKVDMRVVATWAFTFASVILFPLALLTEELPNSVETSSFASILVLGPVLTGSFFMIAFSILPRAGATKTSTVTFIAPLSAVFLGWWVLGEQLALPHFIGMAVIFLGLAFIDGRLFQKKAKPIG